MSAVFIVESEPRRAPPAEQFSDFLRRHRLVVSVTRKEGYYHASLPTGWRVATTAYEYGEPATEYSAASALQAVQRLAQRIAGRYIKGLSVIKVPPLLVPSSMAPGDWLTRDASA